MAGPFCTYKSTSWLGEYGPLRLHFVPIPSAMIPPVDVPEIRSNACHKSLPTQLCILSRITAGIIPRIPPPSIASTLMLFPPGIAMPSLSEESHRSTNGPPEIQLGYLQNRKIY